MLQLWLYRSRATVSPRSASGRLIFRQARNANRRYSITGYLHREDGFYVQYLEGPPEAVQALKRRISCDRRHEAVETLAAGRVETRRFRGWDMAFTADETMRFHLWRGDGAEAMPIQSASPDRLLRFILASVAEGRAASVEKWLPAWIN